MPRSCRSDLHDARDGQRHLGPVGAVEAGVVDALGEDDVVVRRDLERLDAHGEGAEDLFHVRANCLEPVARRKRHVDVRGVRREERQHVLDVLALPRVEELQHRPLVVGVCGGNFRPFGSEVA